MSREPFGGVERERKARTPLPTLDEAKRVTLMGQPSSWDGHGGKPLDVIPDKTLRKARAWFSIKIREEGSKPGMERMRAQRAAITIILADRQAHAPQMELLPEIEQDERGAETPAARKDGFDELLARVQQPDVDDGLPF